MSGSKSGEYVEIDFDHVPTETLSAVCLTIEGEDRWIPKSVIDPEEMPDAGDESGSTFVQEWFAKGEGLI